MPSRFPEGESTNGLEEAEMENYDLVDVDCREKVYKNFEDLEELVKNKMGVPKSITERIRIGINKGRI